MNKHLALIVNNAIIQVVFFKSLSVVINPDTGIKNDLIHLEKIKDKISVLDLQKQIKKTVTFKIVFKEGLNNFGVLILIKNMKNH